MTKEKKEKKREKRTHVYVWIQKNDKRYGDRLRNS